MPRGRPSIATTPEMPRLHVEYWPVERLKPYERNPRKNDKAVDQIRASIREFGFAVPILAKADGEVIDGHLRLKGAIAEKMREVPVIPCDGWTDAQVKAFRLMVNRSVSWAEWDLDALALEFGELKALDFDMSLTGFDPREIDAFTLTPDAAEDEVPPVPEVATSRTGDLWLCGPHRVLCGDTTQPQAEDLESGLKQALRSLQSAESMPSPECRTTLDRILSADYLQIAPDGKVISRADVVGPNSTVCSGRASIIEDERIHLFRDEKGPNRTAVVTYRTKQSGGVTYSQNLYVFAERSASLLLAGREMPVTANNQLSITIDAKAQETTRDVGPKVDIDQLHQWVELSQWASVPSPPGSEEERQKEKARLSMMPSDYIRITRTGNFMTRDEALGGVDQGDVKTITYDNVRIAILSDVALVTYRSTYKSSARTQYNLLVRVFTKRGGTWEEIAGQGFPIPRPPQ